MGYRTVNGGNEHAVPATDEEGRKGRLRSASKALCGAAIMALLITAIISSYNEGADSARKMESQHGYDPASGIQRLSERRISLADKEAYEYYQKYKESAECLVSNEGSLSEKDEEISALATENARLKAENESLKSQASLLDGKDAAASVGAKTGRSATAETAGPEDAAHAKPMGDYGRIDIPGAGIGARVFADPDDDYDGSKGQAIVNAKDSACLMPADAIYDGQPVMIMDHNYQGFSNLSKCVPGQTLMTVTRTDGSVQDYICAEVHDGYNGTDYIRDDVTGQNATRHSLITYTCHPHHPYILLVYWDAE